MRTSTFTRLGILVLALGLTACGSGPPLDDGGGAGDPPPATTLSIVTYSEPATLDPALAYGHASAWILENVYETLYGYAGGSLTALEPRLATAYEITDGGLTYTFDLREGVTFHSGNPFSCRDVEYSIERALVTNDPSSGIWFLAESLLGTPDNANADPSITWEDIDGAITCPGEHTARFHLAQADASFFAKLLYPNASIVDRVWAIENDLWDGTEATWRDWIGVDLSEHGLHTRASGTGAYAVTEWTPGSARITADAFEDYWGGAPDVDEVVVVYESSNAARIDALLAGDADHISTSRSSLDQLGGNPGVLVHDPLDDPTLDWTDVTVSALAFNHAVSPTSSYIGSGILDGAGIPPDFFEDDDVRLCFAHAFDHEAYADDVLGGGHAITMALPPSFLGYNDDLDPYGQDLTLAQQHCMDAWGGELWTNGFAATFVFNQGNVVRQAALESLASNLAGLNDGFEIEVVSLPFSDYLAVVRDRDVPLYAVGWTSDYADPHAFVRAFYACDGYYASTNGFCDPTIDTWVEQARTEPNPDVRAPLYEQLGARAHTLAPYVLLPQAVPFLVTSDDVAGIYRNPMLGGDFLWKDVSKDDD